MTAAAAHSGLAVAGIFHPDNKLRLLRRLRIWSAGCSTGEEPYTLSILLLEESQRIKDWKIEILATDINQRSLDDAKIAVCGSYSPRNLTPHFRQKYFTVAAALKDFDRARLTFELDSYMDEVQSLVHAVYRS